MAGGRGETEDTEAFIQTSVALSTLLADSGLEIVEIHSLYEQQQQQQLGSKTAPECRLRERVAIRYLCGTTA